MTASALLAAAPPVAASGALSLFWLLIALPLAGAAVLLLAGRRADRWGHLLGVTASTAAFVVAVVVALALGTAPAGERVVSLELYDWIAAGAFDLNVDAWFNRGYLNAFGHISVFYLSLDSSTDLRRNNEIDIDPGEDAQQN